MIIIHWSHCVKADYVQKANLIFSQSGVDLKAQPFPAAINGPQANTELLKPLIYIVGAYSAGFLAEAGKHSFKALAPFIKRVFSSLPSSLDFTRTTLKPGQRKFIMLNVCVEDLGGPRVTFMFTDEDEEQYIEVMIDKAIEFIFASVFQNHINKFDTYSYEQQAQLEGIRLQFDKKSLVWKPFDLSRYVVNGKLMINQ